LVGLAIIFNYLIKLDSEARIATLSYLIYKQEFGEANSLAGKKTLSTVFNFYNVSTLKKLKDSIKTQKAIQDKFNEYIANGDSLVLHSPLLSTADSLLPIADSIAEQIKTGKKESFASVGNKLKMVINVEGLLRAYDCFVKAQETGYYPNDAATGAAFKLADIGEKMAYSLKKCIDAAYVFLKANDKHGAQAAFDQSQRLYSLANNANYSIQFNGEDVPYIDSLKNILNQKNTSK
jgi:CRISPR/Cas system CMR-associated protein Cmr5 small subunit